MTRLSSADAFIIYWSCAVLAAVIMLGVAVTENQLNRLTERNAIVQSFNLHREETGCYCVYLFGEIARFKAVYPVAAIANTDRSVTFSAQGRVLTIPTQLSWSLAPAKYWLAEWRRQFMAAAAQTKDELGVYCAEGLDYLHKQARQLQALLR